MEQTQKATFINMLSGAAGALMTVLVIAAITVAYPIDAANVLTKMTNGQAQTSQNPNSRN